MISRTYSGSFLSYCEIDHWLLTTCYSTLKTIGEELDKIVAQGSWRLGIYSDLNTTAVDGCLNRLSTAFEKFKVCPTADVHGLDGRLT